jgi:histone-lysine N-methyltransferase SETMAR
MQHGMLSLGVVMLHDNARPHTAAATQELITTFGWEQFHHPPYSPDLAPSDFHVFLHLKTFLGGWSFHDDNEVKEAVNMWCASQLIKDGS